MSTFLFSGQRLLVNYLRMTCYNTGVLKGGWLAAPVSTTGEESPDCTEQVTGRKPRRVTAGVLGFSPHIGLKTEGELTSFESNRDEWE